MNKPEAKRHVVSLVMNGVEGDSRVIKTAKAAEAAGYKATIVGVADVEVPTPVTIDGASVILVKSGAVSLKAEGLWGPRDKRRLHLLAERHLESVAPAVESLGPSILHSHDMLGLRIGAAVSRRLAVNGKAVPWVHDLHEYVVGLTTIPENFRLTCAEYERRYLRQADHLITVSESLADTVRKHYHLRRAPTVVFNSPSLKRDVVSDGPDVRSAIGLGRDEQLVVYIGVAKKERGCETILRAVACLPSAHICFVSQGAYVDFLRTLAAQSGMSHRFHSVPYVPTDQVTSFIRTADVGIHGLTHYPNGEVAMPNKLFEYLHAGIPVVVSDVAEMKRFVRQHGIGEVFKADDYVSCAAAIGAVLANSAKYRAGLTDELKERYSWEAQASKLKDVYDSLSLLEAGRHDRTLVVSSGHPADSERFSASNGSAQVALASPSEPSAAVDYYVDPGTLGDRAGLLSRVAWKFGAVDVVGDPVWPSSTDVLGLLDAGVAVNGRVNQDSSGALLRSLESERQNEDAAYLREALAQLAKEAMPYRWRVGFLARVVRRLTMPWMRRNRLYARLIREWG